MKTSLVKLTAVAACVLGLATLLAFGPVGQAEQGCCTTTTTSAPAECKSCCVMMSGEPTTATAPAGVVNFKCPIMGNKIDQNNVPASLTREYKGQKVGFCCAGCPGKWDKMTDEQKDKALAPCVKAAETAK